MPAMMPTTPSPALLKRTALAEGVHAMPNKPVLHGDNGSTLKATAVLVMLHWLGVKPSNDKGKWPLHRRKDH